MILDLGTVKNGIVRGSGLLRVYTGEMVKMRNINGQVNQKRTMFSQIGKKSEKMLKNSTNINSIGYNTQFKRHFPGKYTAGNFSKKTRDGNGKKLEQHEYFHYHIKENETNTISLTLTTKQAPHYPSELLSDETLDGQQKNQYVAINKEKKFLLNEEVFTPHKNGQIFCDKHEDKIIQINHEYNIDEKPNSIRMFKNNYTFSINPNETTNNIPKDNEIYSKN